MTQPAAAQCTVLVALRATGTSTACQPPLPLWPQPLCWCVHVVCGVSPAGLPSKQFFAVHEPLLATLRQLLVPDKLSAMGIQLLELARPQLAAWQQQGRVRHAHRHSQ